MARAKNTSRSESRRRTRAEMRAELNSASDQEAALAADAAQDAPQPTQRRSAFKLPDFRSDLRDLPQILTSRKAMALPPAMIILGFLLQLGAGALPTEMGLPIPLVGWVSFAEIGAFYVQMFFLPPALLTFFLAGYIAPRASYLFGALLGILSAALWTVILLAGGAPADPQSPLAGDTDVVGLVGYLFLLNVGYGTFAAAFAAWYRDFLRRMRDQGMARRADREAQERAKRRDQRQSDRRSLKGG